MSVVQADGGIDMDSLLDEILGGVSDGSEWNEAGGTTEETTQGETAPEDAAGDDADERVIVVRSGLTTVPFGSRVIEVPQVYRKNHEKENSILHGSGDLDRDRLAQYLGWQVERTPMFLPDGRPVKTHVAQIRSDNQAQLGVVTAGFQTIQNSELLELADAVRNDNDLRFANAGMVDGGSRVFFQCRGESFDIGGGPGGEDVVTPYMLFCNGHDGSLSCRMIPMTDRMFCQNQLGNIVKRAASLFVIRHTGDTKSKIKEAKRLGRAYFTTIQANREAMLELRNTAVKTQDLQEFFHGCYTKHFGQVQKDATTEEQQRAADRMKESFGDYVKRFESEKHVAGATAWNMANAYTWWLQHKKGAGKDPQKTAQRRLESSLFGVSASRSVDAFRMALEMAG